MTKLCVLSLVLSITLCACGGSPDPDGSSDGPPSVPAGAGTQLDSQAVPADLRHLIPLAQEWGIGDDVDRLAKVDSATPAQRAQLRRAVGPQQGRITQWLDSFEQGEMSPEAGAFMYMQLAIEEMLGLP